MKPETMIAITQDRLATWEEVRRATSPAPDALLEVCRTEGNYCEVNSDLGGIIRYPAEEFQFFALLSELDEGIAN
ncbi:MAG TPA: hypothetical protein VGT24_09500 [Candidatus Acidoferrales bacterium]|nr:hypothetical protein [Candidatus Acidoferrales bacterium]